MAESSAPTSFIPFAELELKAELVNQVQIGFQTAWLLHAWKHGQKYVQEEKCAFPPLFFLSFFVLLLFLVVVNLAFI